MNKDFELMVQRLVDGELNDGERRQLLQSLDRRSDLWREVALAFVEDQSWRSLSLEHLGTRSKRIRKPLATAGSKRYRTNGFGPHLLVVAALLLLSATVVMRFDSDSVGSASQDAQVPIPSENTAASGPYLLRMENQPEIPLYPLDGMVNGFSDQITPAVQRQFLDSGYRIQPDSRVYYGRTDDGRPFIVPVHGLRLHDFVQ